MRTALLGLRTLGVLAGLTLHLLVGSTVPSEAQGLLQQLFGFGPKPQPVYQPAYPPGPIRIAPGHLAPGSSNNIGGQARNEYISKFSSAPRDEDQGGRGGYRTVCVRLCDGYYWPISHATNRGNFNRDASSCRSSCSEDARMFYLPNSADMDSATDLQGRAYSKLATAFKYRKTLVDGCACRQAPWSDAEVARHQKYATIEAARRAEEERRRPIDLSSWVSARSGQEIFGDETELAELIANRPTPEQLAAARASHIAILAGVYAATEAVPLTERFVVPTDPDTDARPPSPGVDVTEAPVQRKPSRRSSAEAGLKPSSAESRQAQRTLASPVQPKPAPLFAGFGQPQYTWPGDPVRR